jgi:hypothetical protein
MVNDVPTLIEYLSGFMTLQPGDLILTGTPDGVVDVNPGDEVVTEIDGIGRLVNTIVIEPSPAPPLTSSHQNSRPMRIHHLINGQTSLARDYFETVNPATQEVLAEVAAAARPR